jgi:hypothetical protein
VVARFLGTSSVLISDGETSVLSDGFVTRPGMLRVALGKIAPDRSPVGSAIARLRVADLAAVFCAHSHYDHALDAPVWALETGAELVGSHSTANIGRGLEEGEVAAVHARHDGQEEKQGVRARCEGEGRGDQRDRASGNASAAGESGVGGAAEGLSPRLQGRGPTQPRWGRRRVRSAAGPGRRRRRTSRSR